MIWEYKIVREPRQAPIYWAQDLLKSMDADGWELVAITHGSMLGDTFYFRRLFVKK